MTYYNANKTKDTTVPKFNRQFVETAVESTALAHINMTAHLPD
jgi:hypothetical protein